MSENTGKHWTVLLVDDDEDFRAGIRGILQMPQDDITMHVLEAGTGVDAMKILEDQHVDLVLLDYMLPDGNGLEWLERISSARSRPVVIMLTGEGSEEVAVEAMKKGALDYLAKSSVTPVRLHHAITIASQRVEMLRTIDRQREELLQAERQRVMLESLGAACHHLAQPATTITAYLDIMKGREQSPDMRDMISNCVEAAETMGHVFRQMQAVSEYRTESYLSFGEDELPRADERILKI
jgi:DNA-binding response OmpR family regulator